MKIEWKTKGEMTPFDYSTYSCLVNGNVPQKGIELRHSREVAMERAMLPLVVHADCQAIPFWIAQVEEVVYSSGQVAGRQMGQDMGTQRLFA